MAELVLLATAWGPKHGGINAFNMDFAKALGRLLGAGKVVCVVLEADEQEINDAAKANVKLLAVGKSPRHNYFEDNRAHEVIGKLNGADFIPGPATWWIGHDAITGELANRLAAISPQSKSAVIHHMSYEDYQAFMYGDPALAQSKSDNQAEIFRAADRAFAVGPLLLETLRRLVEPVEKAESIEMIVPGLAEIEPCQRPLEPFTGITFGRLGRENDRIKQVSLAIAAFANACNRKEHKLLPPSLQNNPQFHIYGVERNQHQELSQHTQRYAGRVITLLPLPYADRTVIFEKLRQMDLAMMLSWHEGFGLVGWEAISAEVPLIVTKNSGLYQLLKSKSCEKFVLGVDIGAREDPIGQQNFSDDDVAKVREKIWEIANDRAAAKRDAQMLKKLLRELNYTWENAAREFAKSLGLAIPPRTQSITKPQPDWDIAKDGPPYLGLKAMTYEHARLFFGRSKPLAELKEKLAAQKFVAVIGASGAGKSSLVWAGLLPKLDEWAVGGIAHWVWVMMKPETKGYTPVQVLAAALAFKFSQNAIDVGQALQQGGAELQQWLINIGQTDPVLKAEPVWQLLLFVDQFEELFSVVDAPWRKPFIDALDRLMASGKVRVVATMRAEFLGQCMDCEAFGSTLVDWFNAGQMLLAAPELGDLRAMVEGPAERAGLSFDTGRVDGKTLVDTLVEATGLKPGNLALMAFALEQLYNKRQGTLMTWQAHQAIDGVAGAIANKAEEVFNASGVASPEAKSSLLGEVFRELVEIDEHSTAPTRRRARLARWGLDGRWPDHPTPTQSVILAFIQARLLLTDREAKLDQRYDPTLEVAHEALFRNWPLLAGWIEQRKDKFLLRKRLQRDAAEWHRRGRPQAFRWVDQLALDAGEMIRDLPYDNITPLEKEFLGPVHRDDMLRLIRQADTPHETRATIGVRLALLGDDRPGVGVKKGELSSEIPSTIGGGNTVEIRNPLPSGEGLNSTALPVGDHHAVWLPDIVWCEVPAGQVVLELEDGQRSPPLQVAAFEIAKYPVTQAQYRLFVEAGDGYYNPAWWEGLEGPYTEAGRQIPPYDNHPAVNVNWYEATAYCRWLSQQLGKTVRLPTEWEWQQAATLGNPEYEYPWGEWDGRRCNSQESNLYRTIAVGLYAQDWPEDRPLDMAGNVWEWCGNLYAINEPNNNDDRRAVRGGSWGNFPRSLRSADRSGGDPTRRDDNDGFRLAQDL